MGKYDEIRKIAAQLREQQRHQEEQNKRFGRAVRDVNFVAKEAKTHAVPPKRHTKGKKVSESWHLASVRGVPGGAGKSGASIFKMIEAKRTGTRVREEPIGLIKSAQNANTTSTRHDGVVRGLIK